MTLITIIMVVIISLVPIGFFAYFRYRKTLREAKNYERGLKMVPLLIHLPPTSDDIDSGGRDARDVVEENISKAQVLYNIIASTATKGFKSKFYGQRHISLEMIAANGGIKYYAAVPVALVSVVSQAVTSAYPSSRLEEVEEHNLFNVKGKMAGTVGGEMVLKKHFGNPISTFQETKRDVIQSILNSFAVLDKDDGAGVQILIRPASEGWAKAALSQVSKLKKDKEKKGGVAKLGLKGLSEALWKPPEAKETKPEDKQLSSGEQAKVDAIEEKVRHPGYETAIRLVASSENSSKSQTVLGNLQASFSLFDAPGRNGFKFVPAKVTEDFVTSFIFRFFPPELNKNILNSVELASIFHFPDRKSTPTSQLERQASKQVDGPNNVPDEGTLIGYNIFRGKQKPIRLSDDDRRRHMYIIGQTGTGKSWFLKNLISQDVVSGRGLAFIDPHGDTAEEIMGMIPEHRTEDVIYFAPGEMEYPIGLNLFEFQYKEQQDFLIQETINMLYKLYDPQHQGIMGPRYENIFRNAALAVMAGPESGTFIDIPRLFNDKAYLNGKLKYVTDQPVLDFWLKEMPASERSNDFGEVKGWFVSKFGAFLSNQMMRNVIGQSKSGFDIRKVMDEGKILLVNLSKGKTGELNAKLLGMIFVMKFYAAAMGRANIPESERRDFTLYVDEFQNFSTETFSDILSEARKYRLSLIVANQFVGQLTDEVRDAVFGNVGTVISSRTGANDADFLVKYFSPVFDADDLTKMPNQNWVTQTLLNGVPTQPFSMASPRLDITPNPDLAKAIKRLSDAKYGRPQADVEKEIFDRLKSTDQTPATSAAGSKKPVQRPDLKPVGTHASNGSFIDDWLQNRGQQSATRQPQLSGPSSSQRPDLKTVSSNGQPAHNDVSAPIDWASSVSSGSINANGQPQLSQEAPPTPSNIQNYTTNIQTDVYSQANSSPMVDVATTVGSNPQSLAKTSTSTEDDQSVNVAIRDGALTSGEIAIDRKGLIHHSDSEDL